MNIALATTWQDRLNDLGNISPARVRIDPAPGSATVEDVVRLRNTERRLYELVDGTLVEKAMGWQESFLAGLLLHWLHTYLDQHRLGVATGADGLTRLFGDTVRGPDVAVSIATQVLRFNWLASTILNAEPAEMNVHAKAQSSQRYNQHALGELCVFACNLLGNNKGVRAWAL